MSSDDADHTEDIGDKARVFHRHYCMVCDDYWQHHEGDAACVETPHLCCPEHEDSSPTHEEYYY